MAIANLTPRFVTLGTQQFDFSGNLVQQSIQTNITVDPSILNPLNQTRPILGKDFGITRRV